MEMGRVGALLQADVQIYEMARGHLLEACRYLRSKGFAGKLHVPRSFPLDAYMYAAKGNPSEEVLFHTAAYGGQLRELQERNPAQDVVARNFTGLDNEIRVVVFYATRRAQESGVTIPAAPPIRQPKQPHDGKVLGAVKEILDSPQAAGTIGVGVLGLMSMFAMMMANGRKRVAPVVIQHGAYEEIMGQGPEQAAAEVEARPFAQEAVQEPAAEAEVPEEHDDVADAVAAVQQINQRLGNIAVLFDQKEA
jgi:hypothetical protein